LQNGSLGVTFLAGLNDPERAPGRELGEGYKYVALGMQFAGGILMFMAAGWGLDRWLHLTPVFTIAGTLVGAVLSFLVVYRKLQAETEARKRKAGEGR
jgi:F0F1-type ATP synthase assembly protein I